jgi:hypothetical protein
MFKSKTGLLGTATVAAKTPIREEAFPVSEPQNQGFSGAASNVAGEKLLLSPDSGGGLEIVAALLSSGRGKTLTHALGREYAYRPAERVNTSGTFPPRVRHVLAEHQSQLARQNHEKDELCAQWVHPLP